VESEYLSDANFCQSLINFLTQGHETLQKVIQSFSLYNKTHVIIVIIKNNLYLLPSLSLIPS